MVAVGVSLTDPEFLKAMTTRNQTDDYRSMGSSQISMSGTPDGSRAQ